MSSMNVDPFGRKIDYLRISVTDRCNERCLYCMPEGYAGWAQRADHLRADEVVRAVEAAASLGFRKFRVTGGEPLVRQDLVEILERIWAVPGVETLGVSTNGLRLAELAGALKRAGVRSLNVSLDALDPVIYRRITGGEVERVLEGLAAAREAGFERIKLNTVLLRHQNETELARLVEFAAAQDHPIRLIELMPMSRDETWTVEHFLSGRAAKKILGGDQAFEPAPETRLGHGPAAYTRHLPTGAVVGWIGALTRTDFCSGCNKLRLTADGKLRPCLGRHGEIDVMPALRSGNAEAVREVFLRCLAGKPADHSFTTDYLPGRPMVAIGG
ncbi:MAG: GTP 3',8-cyclase MoaA [Verrucomicrobiia bacterium]